MCQENDNILILSDETLANMAMRIEEGQKFKKSDTSFNIASAWLSEYDKLRGDGRRCELSSILILSEKLRDKGIGKIEKVKTSVRIHRATKPRKKRSISE